MSKLSTSTEAAVSKLFSDLLDRRVTARAVEAEIDAESALIATYVTDSDDVVALCLASPELAIWVGGLLGMIPRSGLEEAIANNKLSEVLGDNFREVMNIAAQVLCSDDSPHVRFVDLALESSAWPEGVGEILAQARQRSDFEVEISDHGSGQIAFLIA